MATPWGTPEKLQTQNCDLTNHKRPLLTVAETSAMVAPGVRPSVRTRMGTVLDHGRLRGIPVGRRPLTGGGRPRVQERPVHVGGGARGHVLRRRLLSVPRRLLRVRGLIRCHEWRLSAGGVWSVDVVAGAVSAAWCVGVVRRLVGHS